MRLQESSEIIGWNCSDFLNHKFPPKDPLVEGLLHRRDMVAFVARRRHGKTTFLLNLAVAGATATNFIGHKIPTPFRTLLLTLEDDSGDLQAALIPIVGGANTDGIKVVTKDNFLDRKVLIHIRDSQFRSTVMNVAKAHRPDLVVIDNLAQVVDAEYNDASVIQRMVEFMYWLARTHNAAVVCAAHPKKQDQRNIIHLANDEEAFAEQAMGSSHFINSTGSIWAIERNLDDGTSVFLGGRQRGDGHAGSVLLRLDDDKKFQVLDDCTRQLDVVVNTPIRVEAWSLLPNVPFGYREGQELVAPVMKSSSTYHAWMSQLRNAHLVIEMGDKLVKVATVSRDIVGDGV